MRRLFYRLLFCWLKIERLYREVVLRERGYGVRGHVRRQLQSLLASVDRRNPFFAGKFTEFLRRYGAADDDAFLRAYGQLPSYSKQDYARAGTSVMARPWAGSDPRRRELSFDGRPLSALARLRRGRDLMPMATGGSTSLPLVVWMTHRHMFSMLFTFFKCWARMGWRPGDRMLVFYPRNTYNIDEMVRFNRFSGLTGFRYHLFDHVDEATVRGLVEELNRFKPTLLLVFPSPLNLIAHLIRRHGMPLRHHPPLINVSGETFFDCQRRNIAAVFTASRIEDSYGSVELGEIAHEGPGGLEVFADVAYVETERNAAGQPEMIVTRLHLTDFPFIRYRMKDLADVQLLDEPAGRQRFVITRIEGKDSNYILSDRGERFYPSFFNRLVNQVNAACGDAIVEIKVFERGQRELDLRYIVREPADHEAIAEGTRQILRTRMSNGMTYAVRFVDTMDHDYRRKYRVIHRAGDLEFAGGMVGDPHKQGAIRDVATSFQSLDRPTPPPGDSCDLAAAAAEKEPVTP